jgi:hypothetical protein
MMLDETAKERVKQLCDLIAREQDHRRFSLLLTELNQVLEGARTGTRGSHDSQDGQDFSASSSPESSS